MYGIVATPVTLSFKESDFYLWMTIVLLAIAPEWIRANRIGRFLARFNIRNVHVPTEGNAHLLIPVRDGFGPKVPVVYYIL
jgi:hypothetical protein